MLSRRLSRALITACRNYHRTTVRHKNLGEDYSPSETTLDPLDSEGGFLFIEGVSPVGFKLQGGVRIFGPLAIFPKSIFQWNVSGAADVNEKSLRLFTILEPKIDILVLGLGEKGAKLSPELMRHLRSKKITVEICPTDQAISTFNYLNAEKRYVAAGLIPPSYLNLKTSSGNIPIMSSSKLPTSESIDPFLGKRLKTYDTDKVVNDELARLGEKVFDWKDQTEIEDLKEGGLIQKWADGRLYDELQMRGEYEDKRAEEEARLKKIKEEVGKEFMKREDKPWKGSFQAHDQDEQNKQSEKNGTASDKSKEISKEDRKINKDGKD